MQVKPFKLKWTDWFYFNWRWGTERYLHLGNGNLRMLRLYGLIWGPFFIGVFRAPELDM